MASIRYSLAAIQSEFLPCHTIKRKLSKPCAPSSAASADSAPETRRDVARGIALGRRLLRVGGAAEQGDGRRRLDPFEDERNREVHVVHRPEDGIVEGVETHGDAVALTASRATWRRFISNLLMQFKVNQEHA